MTRYVVLRNPGVRRNVEQENKRIDSNMILAILFTSGDPVSLNEVSSKFEVPGEEIRDALNDLEESLKDTSLRLLVTENSARLATRPEYAEYIKKFYGSRPQRLSQEALETLAVIIYRQPVTRQEIEEIRKADCEKTITTLLKTRLVKLVGNLAQQGAPILYTITEECLYRFGVSSYAELSSIVQGHGKDACIGNR
jgi:segregation and condensation protein B